MSFVPQPCCPPGGEECCPTYLSGFCLSDGTSIVIVLEGEVQTGWINLQTGVFTFGTPPVGTTLCAGSIVSDWAVSHAPAAGVQASASKAAVVGSRHIATSISFSVITTTTAPTTMTLTIILRDGASGVGTVLMTWRVRVSAAMTDQNVSQVTLGGLNVAGSDNTSMTLEFDVGDINTLESVNLTGHTV